MSLVTAMKVALIQHCLWTRPHIFPEYIKHFRWSQKKKSEGHSLVTLLAIPMIIFFLTTDLGTVDPTIHAQALHNVQLHCPPLPCDSK
jgi:hypothetical protein